MYSGRRDHTREPCPDKVASKDPHVSRLVRTWLGYMPKELDIELSQFLLLPTKDMERTYGPEFTRKHKQLVTRILCSYADSIALLDVSVLDEYEYEDEEEERYYAQEYTREDIPVMVQGRDNADPDLLSSYDDIRLMGTGIDGTGHGDALHSVYGHDVYDRPRPLADPSAAFARLNVSQRRM